MRLFLKYIVFIGCFGLASLVNAQSGTYHTIQDFESWTVAGLNYKPTQNLKLNLSQQLRLKDNTSTLEQYFTELTLRYKLPHRFKLGGGARYIHKNDDQGKNQGIRKYLRWNADLEYNHKINRFTWAYRLRYQSKDELEKTTDILQNTLRAKVGFAYNFKQWKLDPEFSSEIYHGLTDNEGLNRLRFTLGTQYELHQNGDIGVFIRTEKELTGRYPKRTNILGIKYNYTLKNKN